MKLDTNLQAQIIKASKTMLGDLREPNYALVNQWLRDEAWRPLVNRLRERVSVENVATPDSMSFTGRLGQAHWWERLGKSRRPESTYVWLSPVGPFAVLAEYGRDDTNEHVRILTSSPAPSTSPTASAAIEVLQEANLALLSREVLEFLPPPSSGADGSTPVWKLLFEPNEPAPWSND